MQLVTLQAVPLHPLEDMERQSQEGMHVHRPEPFDC